MAGWVEFALLRSGLHRKLGAGVSVSLFVAKLWLAAAAAVMVGSAGRWLPYATHPIYGAIATLGPFGAVYLIIGAAVAPEGRRLVLRLLRR